MNAKDVIRTTIGLGDKVLQTYVGDLSDDDLKLCPVEGMNPIAWQLGHLILSERSMIEGIRPGSCPALPAGFDQDHSREAPSSCDPAKFRSKAEYLRLHEAQRAATLKVLDELSEPELDQPAP